MEETLISLWKENVLWGLCRWTQRGGPNSIFTPCTALSDWFMGGVDQLLSRNISMISYPGEQDRLPVLILLPPPLILVSVRNCANEGFLFMLSHSQEWYTESVQTLSWQQRKQQLLVSRGKKAHIPTRKLGTSLHHSLKPSPEIPV